MARTKTLQQIQDRWAGLCGLDKDNIIDDDASDFIEFANGAVNYAWQRAEWPFALRVFPKNTDQFGLVDLSSDTDISEVLRAYDSDPWRTNNAMRFPNVYSVENADVEGVYIPDASKTVTDAVTSITRSGTTATVTTTDTHNMGIGQSTTIAGAAESDYNGTFVVTSVPSSTTFTYEVSGSPSTPATGTITSTKATVYLDCRIRETIYTSLTDTVPFKLAEFIAFRASSDWLKSEGQEEKGTLRWNQAEGVLLEEIDRLERQQSQQPPTRVNNRVSGRR